MDSMKCFKSFMASLIQLTKPKSRTTYRDDGAIHFISQALYATPSLTAYYLQLQPTLRHCPLPQSVDISAEC